MICPKCGLEAEGNFCSFCGTPLTQSGAENVQSVGVSGDERKSMVPGGAEEEQKSRKMPADTSRPEKSRKAASGSREDKGAQKQQKQLEKRIHSLEEERERLSRERQQEERRKKRESRRREREEREIIPDNGMGRFARSSGEAAASQDKDDRGAEFSAVSAVSSGVAGVVVLVARAMQLICCFLMLGMTWATFRAFRYGGDGLGNITSLISERNYGLAIYLAAAAISIIMGIIWSLWIISGKAAGGKLRLKKYDTGRGFIPFLLCMAVVLAAGPLSVLITVRPIIWQNAGDGVFAVLEAVNTNHEFLLFCSLSGAMLSFIRKLLRV